MTEVKAIKTALFIFTLSLASVATYGQDHFIELSAVRFSKKTGLFNSRLYPFRLSVADKIVVGGKINYFFGHYTGLRYYDYNINRPDARSVEISRIRGIEINSGIGYMIRQWDRFTLQGLVGGFYEQGRYAGDFVPSEGINHRRQFFGGELQLKFHYKLSRYISLIYSMRYRTGKFRLTHIRNPDIRRPLYEENIRPLMEFDPINVLGLRFYFKNKI